MGWGGKEMKKQTANGCREKCFPAVAVKDRTAPQGRTLPCRGECDSSLRCTIVPREGLDVPPLPLRLVGGRLVAGQIPWTSLWIER